MICNVSTANIEEHDYALMSRLFLEAGSEPGDSDVEDIFGSCNSVLFFFTCTLLHIDFLYESIERGFFSNGIT